MAYIPKKVRTRLVAGLKRFQPILTQARARDVNEADTVTIVADIFARVFGYDKYSEITKEYAIRGTYCDLAIVMEDKPSILTEVKAIGLDLKLSHMKQAVAYAANKGVDWVVLTNGAFWKVFRIIFGKPINQELVIDFDFLSLNPRVPADLEILYLLTREGYLKSALPEYRIHQQATNRFMLGAIIQSEPVLKVIRRELKKVNPDVKVGIEDVKNALVNEVLKREVVEGDKAQEAGKKLTKVIRKKAAKRKIQKSEKTCNKMNGGVDVEAEQKLTQYKKREKGDGWKIGR